jgi:hypothetical protein
MKRNSLTYHTPHSLNDDYLYSPIPITIQSKLHLSLQTKADDPYQSDDIPNTTTEHEPTLPMNDLLNTEWQSDSQPTKTTIEKS